MSGAKRGIRAFAPLLVVVALAAAACNLPMVKAGAKCSKVGDFAQDGTYLLKCNAKRRWERGITLAQGQALIDAINALKTTTTTTPPPPPPPALTSFGAINGLVGTGSGQIVPALYTTLGDNCSWARYDAAGHGLGGTTAFNGREFMQVFPSDVRIVTGGPCQWTQAPGWVQSVPANGDATYRVGIEVQPGWYRSSGGANCYWGIYDSFDGSSASVLDGSYSPGPQLVHLLTTDAAFESRDCGVWSPIVGVPSVRMSIVNPNHAPIFPLTRATWTEAEVVQSGAGVRTSSGSLHVEFLPATGEQLHVGTSTLLKAGSQTAGTVGLDLSYASATCSAITGSIDIGNVEYDLSGHVVHITATFTARCGTSTDPLFGGYLVL